MKRILFIFFSVVIILAGCNSVDPTLSTSLDESNQQIDRLKVENEKLKKEIDELKNGPDKLLATAKKYFDKKDLDNLNATMETLESNHPSAPELSEVKELSKKLNEIIEKENEEAAKEAAEKAEADKKRLANATSKMRSEHDEIKEVTWYKDKTSAKYINMNSFHIYFAKSDDGLVLYPHVLIQYAGDDWVFVDKYIIKADDDKFEIDPGTFGVERNNDSKVWEYYDFRMEKSDFDMIRKIIASTKTTIRHQGSQTHYDYIVTKNEKLALQNVLDAYEALGGTEP